VRLFAIDVVLAVHVLVGREADAGTGFHRERDAGRPDVETETKLKKWNSTPSTSEPNAEEDALECTPVRVSVPDTPMMPR